MMDAAPALTAERQYSQLPDQLPFRNDDADLFSFLDGLGTDQNMQNNDGGAAAARTAKASFLRSTPSWLLPAQDSPASTTGGMGLPAISLEPNATSGAPLSTLALPEIPLGGLPSANDHLFMSSLGPSTALPQPTNPYQQMPHELGSPSLRSPQGSGHAVHDMPSLPMWPPAHMPNLLPNDDLGGFVPVSSGQLSLPLWSM